MLMDWGACHRGLGEAMFKFTTNGALVSERGDVDLVIGGVTAEDQTRFEMSDPYLRTGKAVMVRAGFRGRRRSHRLAGRKVGVIGGGQPAGVMEARPAGGLREKAVRKLR